MDPHPATRPPGGAIADTMTRSRDRAFVGRATELARFRAALDGAAGARSVHYLHGPGGIGKSALLRRFARDARAAGRTVVEVDGRTVDPTPEGFQEAIGAALTDPALVLLVDTFERCQGLEGWLWERFLPQLPAGAIAVVAGRTAPEPYWTADPGWAGLLWLTSLRNLTPDDATDFLRTLGVPAGVHRALLAFTGGNPLALALAAAVAAQDDAGASSWEPRQDVIAGLLPRLIGEVPGPAHRRALEVCAHAYVTTESLLRAVMGPAAAELFGWLRVQPFIEATSAGLFPHDVIREALERDLRWRDHQEFAELHRQVHQYFAEQLRAVPEARLLPATGALIYLYRSDGLMSQFNTWSETGLVEDLPFRPEQRGRVLELVAAAEGERSAAIAAYWLDQQPGAFRVYRSTQTGDLVACSAWLRLTGPEGGEVDPVVAAAWHHGRANGGVRAGEHIAVARFSVSATAYQRPSAAMTLTQWRATGEMVRADRLAFSHIVMRDDGYWNDHLRDINMLPIDAAPTVGDHRYALFCHDWRAQPADAWLREKSTSVVSGAPMTAAVSAHRGELVVLSRPEFDAAVRDALRSLRHPRALAGNPLNRSRLVAESGQTLAEVLSGAMTALREERGGEKRHRALTVTYLKGSPTQEAAAARLGLPFSTYRRHLASGTEQLGDLLWHRELHGAP
ncbi:ATP-binding protein [Actinoplanes sp. ATCC 53533]|nr:ATP-binding protein [Actinoplanes sp. ATCC 53533]